MPFPHSSVNHSARQDVRGDVWTNGIESFWAVFKRGYRGIYHQMCWRHLHRYVCEFEGRLSDRHADTLDRMSHMASGMVGKRLRYADLIAVPVEPKSAEPVEPYIPPPGLVDALARYLMDGTRPGTRPKPAPLTQEDMDRIWVKVHLRPRPWTRIPRKPRKPPRRRKPPEPGAGL